MYSSKLFDGILFIISLFGAWQVYSDSTTEGHLVMPGAFSIYFIFLSILLADRLTIKKLSKRAWLVALLCGLVLLGYKNWEVYPLFKEAFAFGLMPFIKATWVWWPLNFAALLFIYRAYVFVRRGF